ncbi:MAG: hypothetical protein EHM93_09210 [Bacteroidales bacterium]|nr:MAG: hypothetical protein EHM93_09210 [Bacteroidales bacterium]
MKAEISKKLAILIALSLYVFLGFAQTPQGFSYQAVVRNGSGTPIVDQFVGVEITLQNTLEAVLYTETHRPRTNAQGVISITIGGGEKVGTNTFASIPWNTGDVLVKVRIDPTGSTNYTLVGAPTKLQSVPYALYTNPKEVVSSPGADPNAPIFEVKNSLGQVVFGVYQGGVRVNVEDVAKSAKGGFAVGGLSGSTKAGSAEFFRITPDSARIYINDSGIKGAKGGFAVGGLSGSTKGSTTFLSITPDSTRIYIDNSTTKGAKGGFAVGGLSGSTKGVTTEFLRITPDSTRIYIDNSTTKGAKGGFAVGGLSGSTKGVTTEFLRITPDSTRIYIDDSNTKGAKGGFAVGGLSGSTKGGKADFFNVSAATAANVIKNESRIMWYPKRSALLAGEISVLHPDSVGLYSMSLGYRNIAHGSYSQAMGYKSVARGDNSTAIGYEAIAAGVNSFSFGNGSKALGFGSFAFGAKGVDANGVTQDVSTDATGAFSFAFGLGSKAKALGSFVLGVNCESSNKFAFATGFNSKALGLNSVAMGVDNVSQGPVSFTMGYGNTAIALYAFAFGASNNANGQSSLAFGQENTAGGLYSVAGGYKNVASGNYSFAVGTENYATGHISLAVGKLNNCSGIASAAFGQENISGGSNSFASGYKTKASGQNSFALGNLTQAVFDNAIAFGDSSSAEGYCSIATGYHVTAKAYASLVIGQYNKKLGSPSGWVDTDPIFVIGNGTGPNSFQRNDALVIYKNGKMKVDGDLYPNDNGSPFLGTASNRWSVIYAVNNVIQTSDARLKKDIINLSYGLKDILKLRPVTFIWKDGKDQSIKLGLIAQEVQPIINEVVDVGDDQDKTLGINYTSLIPVLINSIQEQQKIIEEQKAKNIVLENQINEISKKLEELEKRIK